MTLKGSAKALVSAYDVALLDLDGTVYTGQTAIPGAPEALHKAQAEGMRLAYVTNNASRTPAAVAALLAGMDAPAGDVVTSAQAAARLVAERLPAGAPVLVVGSTALRLALRERGLRPVSMASDQPLAVVQGYTPGLGYSALMEGTLAVSAGAWFVASNGDLTIPGPHGTGPGNGSVVQVIATATGVTPVMAGKPEPPLHRESVLRTGAKNPLAVGDRLDTDILGAHRVGVDSLLVLTGVTDPAQAILAAPDQRPTYLAQDLNGLLEPHPEIESHDGDFSCRGWTASFGRGGPGGRLPPVGRGGPGGRLPPVEGGKLNLSGDGDRIDALRALCAAAWSRSDISAEAITSVLKRVS